MEEIGRDNSHETRKWSTISHRDEAPASALGCTLDDFGLTMVACGAAVLFPGYYNESQLLPQSSKPARTAHSRTDRERAMPLHRRGRAELPPDHCMRQRGGRL
ncbi:hypothetical protein NDU88_004435 [Pleurodeles waltl]|uniref:Uncharacterized protein n=1 Tax=Pleurodeles waltl TaxID=8319 RepID=A0AAV7W905_PLEWA|nr:hypothetical protein NDU88_004435 [Pleurodeles waltl]